MVATALRHYCSCTPDWTGYDCSIPVCVAIADSKTVYDLLTVDVEKIVNFELNPCESDKLEDVPAEGERMYFDKSFWRFGSGWKMSHGNCSRPMQCTCTCFEENPQWIPWQDPLNRALPRGYGFGTTQICADGYEGNLRPNGFFMSCHIKIKVPTVLEEYSITFIILGIFLGILLGIAYHYYRQWLKRRWLRKKAERRRSRKSSESSIGAPMGGRKGSSRIGSSRVDRDPRGSSRVM